MIEIHRCEMEFPATVGAGLIFGRLDDLPFRLKRVPGSFFRVYASRLGQTLGAPIELVPRRFVRLTLLELVTGFVREAPRAFPRAGYALPQSGTGSLIISHF
jgi:hypothetical protein